MHNLGVRLAGSWSDTTLLSQEAFLGGLDSVRGFVHGRFHGRVWWLANIEWRAPFYVAENLVLQGVGFWDAARTAATLDSLMAGGSGGQGAGGGLRLILPKVYRLNIRADYGLAWDGSERGFSFGLQQFF
jgi:hemolysin activation/secretion protein